jgi:hypothetical protein
MTNEPEHHRHSGIAQNSFGTVWHHETGPLPASLPEVQDELGSIDIRKRSQVDRPRVRVRDQFKEAKGLRVEGAFDSRTQYIFSAHAFNGRLLVSPRA